ncbi:MAG: AI-2E family transporter [Candidatus Cloacimonetes bacterium]|nr:AI-2E family transporter [Candidatus Cloacimonadota bacterium]
MTNSRSLNISLGILSMAIMVYTLKTLQSIFIPLTFAIFLTFLFHPINRFMKDKRIPVSVNMLVLVVIILFTFTLMGAIVYTSIASFVTEFPKYEEALSEMTKSFFTFIDMPFENVTSFLNNKVNWFQIADKLSLSKILSGTMGTFIDFFVKLLLTIVFMLFILIDRDDLNKRVKKVLAEDRISLSENLVGKIGEQINKYIVNKTLISLATGLISMIFIAIFGIDFVVISGLLIFILNYIPNVGSIIASAFPIIICFIQYGLSWQLVAISSALVTTQMVIGNFVEPRVMGHELQLTPLFVLISLIFWFWVWGPVGMILAVPLTSAITIIIKEIPSLKVISALISYD